MRSFSLFIYTALALPVLSSPVRRSGGGDVPDFSATNSGNSYSGAGGTAQGGSIREHEHTGLLGILGADGGLLNIGSKNAGMGGNAGSGPTRSGFGGGGSRSHRGSGNHESSNLVNSGNTYSGQGGNANGGDVEGSDGLINIDSGELLCFIMRIPV